MLAKFRNPYWLRPNVRPDSNFVITKSAVNASQFVVRVDFDEA